MTRWSNRDTTIKYAKELLREGTSEKVLMNREGLRQLVKAAQSRPRILRPALRARTSSPEAHPCYDEHQPGCDCVIPQQSASPTPLYLDRLARTSEPEAREAVPHCQLCGGQVEGWTCQTCEASFEEVDGLLVLKSEKAHPSPDETAEKLRAAVEALPAATYQKSETITLTAPGEETFAELRKLVRERLPAPFACAGGSDRIRKGDPVAGTSDRVYDRDQQAHVAFVAHHPRQALATLSPKEEGGK